MNSRAFTLSLLIAGLAVFMVISYIDGVENQYKTDYGEQVPVVTAKIDIKELELIDDRKIGITSVPKKYLMPGAFQKVELLYNTIAAVPIKKGEQITQPRVTFPGAKSGLAKQISIGKRAFAIQVTEDQAVGRLIKPGDRVDVLAAIDYAGGRKEFTKVRTILQDVYVLATGKRVTREIPLVGLKIDKEIKKLDLTTVSNFNTVSLELSPYEVQKLLFLVNLGTGIHLSLRNNDDKAIERISGIKLFDVLDEDGAEAKAYFQEKAAAQERKR